eukprot:gnl/MRDRNA2_/MRDRNA2_16756_c0_seq1.p1 gnl/MRDRNA2_/MRDRNA2_16756_c0~~gnl/MRDRNA2_/MRDRNA2_16756_c0_seq1.p1  ORF type:complete len:386 (-),score=58.78 gnl/MRDRNA2_/MRDRNA2_16756_c0_seq1:19-1176(-)
MFYAGTCVFIILMTVMLNMITSRLRHAVAGTAQGHGHGHSEEQGHSAVSEAPAHEENQENPEEIPAASPVAQDHATPAGEGHGHDDHAGHGEHDDHGHHHSWQHVADECEMEAMAIIFGAFFNMFTVTLQGGGEEAPAWDCDLEAALGHPCISTGFYSKTVKSLMTVSILVGLGFLIVTFSKMQEKYKDDHFKFELFNVIEAFTCFSFAWVMQRFMKLIVRVATSSWEEESLTVWGSLVTKKTLGVTLFWPVFVLSIVIVDKLADNGVIRNDCADRFIQGMSMAIAVMVESMYGFAIAAVIHSAFNADENPGLLFFSELACIAILLFIIMPAWTSYLVPTAMLPIPQREHEEDLPMSKKMQARFAKQMDLLKVVKFQRPAQSTNS